MQIRMFKSLLIISIIFLLVAADTISTCPRGENTDGDDGIAAVKVDIRTQDADDDWERYEGNPVFVKGTGRQWDAAGITCFLVRHFPWSHMMWYTSEKKFGLALSRNGIDWTRRDSPVFVPDSGVTIWGPEVLHDGDIYHMWYVSRGPEMDGISHATSEDGIEWENSENNPVISSGGCHAVIWDGEQNRMFIQAQGFRLAYSGDGDRWTDWDDQEVVFESGRRGDWDEIMAAPSVAYYEDQLHLWYTGADTIGNTRGEIALGHCTSDDWGETWNVPDDRTEMRGLRPIEGWTHNIYTSGVDYDGENINIWYAGTGGTGGFGFAWREVNSVRNREYEIKEPDLWSVSPNPTAGAVKINYLGTLDFGVNIKIFDMNGRRVFNDDFAPHQPIRIDPALTGLPVGEYVIKINSPKKEIHKMMAIVK